MKESTRLERRKSIEDRMMGNAPRYFDVVFKNESERKIALTKGLQWFGHYYEPKGAVSFVQKWLKKSGLLVSSKPISINPTYLSPSIVSLMKMVEVGWVLSDSEKKRIQEHFSPVSADSWFPSAVNINPETEKETEPKQDKVVKVQIRNEIVDFLKFFDQQEESWVKNKKRISSLSEEFSKTLREIPSLTKSEISIISNHVASRLQEYEDAYNRVDEDLVEAYDTLSRTVLGSIVNRLKSYKTDLENQVNVVKVIQKAKRVYSPRKPNLSKRISELDSLKYQKVCPEYSLVSINPAKIVGAKYLITFNTKYNQMTIFHASGPEGFSVKGTTLYGYDEAKSVMRRLRKPEEFLPFASKKTPASLEREWKKLTTVEYPAKTGRIGEDTILLRVL
jgi:hypothetical protein